MKTDIQINQEATKKPIVEVAQKINLQEIDLKLFGDIIAKINIANKAEKGRLILVTAINPTSAGEGKTTTSIGLNEGMRKLGYNSLLALREPSLGPVFGVKGGAAGGGMSQITPIEDINLHFTGDIHAITSSNNLISAAIDNHIYWGNSLDIKQVVFKRCMDMNDRVLREINIKVSKVASRIGGFNITAASEIMAIFTLAKNEEDLRKRIDNIILGFNSKNEPIFVRELKVTGAVIALLKDALAPNLVQTLENNPAIVHGGPFANIATGCNSIIATKMALQLSDYVITEAGFGADLGAEKFLNIKTREAELKPEMVVLVATIRALKMQGGVKKADLNNENIDALAKGIKTLDKHINIIKSFNMKYLVAINSFAGDHPSERKLLEKWLEDNNHLWSYSDGWAKGGDGTLELAQKVVDNLEHREIKYTYELNDSIQTKIEKVSKNIYGATNVEYSPESLETIKMLEENNLDKQYVCMAKTPSSLTDDPKKIGVHDNWTLKVDRIEVSNGAGLIIVQCGTIFRMPGLSRNSNYENIDFDGKKITGLD